MKRKAFLIRLKSFSENRVNEGGIFVNIALIAHDKKKELMVQFCIAYSGILSKHSLYATGTTGKMIIENTGLNVYRFFVRTAGRRSANRCENCI